MEVLHLTFLGYNDRPTDKPTNQTLMKKKPIFIKNLKNQFLNQYLSSLLLLFFYYDAVEKTEISKGFYYANIIQHFLSAKRFCQSRILFHNPKNTLSLWWLGICQKFVAPLVAWKCNYPHFWPTDRPTNQHADMRWVII